MLLEDTPLEAYLQVWQTTRPDVSAVVEPSDAAPGVASRVTPGTTSLLPREQGFIDMKAFDAGVGDEGCIAFDFRTAGEGETNYQFTVPPVHA